MALRSRWWRWLLGIGGGLVLLGIFVLVVGMSLPVSHSASVSARVAAPPDDVWSLITEVERFPEWRPGITDVQPLPPRDGQRIWREASSMGTLTLAVEEWDPPRRLVTRIADEGLPFGGTWTYLVEPDGDGSRLTITEHGEVHDPFFRFMSRFVFGHEATLREYLEGVQAELGEGPVEKGAG